MHSFMEQNRNSEINSCMYGQFTSKELRIYTWERIVSLKNSIGKPRQPFVKEWSWTNILYRIQKSVHNGLTILM